jgi:acyl-[acyl-carrier-protein]-phospholipid O-acyltransferase/long-chain-fatty-acid--[acyl-carrier-protein] ligase
MSSARAHDVRQAINELACDWFELLKQGRVSLGRLFVRAARKHWFKPAMSDTTGKDLKYGKALITVTVLAAQLRKLCADQEKVGIVLPASVGGSLVNIAITMLGKIPVNLNFTASAEAVADAIEQCQIKTIISSRAFLERVKDFKEPEGTVCLEDIMPGITGRDKITALIKAVFAPERSLVSDRGFNPNSIATIIFSSGTTGEPKGIMLSHHNLISNMESFGMVFPFTHRDNMCAALPFFHSFGFACTLWFPLVSGFSVIYHPNPLDGDTIARIVREKRSTILLATPTFLLAYIRRAKREDFSSLLYTITGAEKLRERIALAFEKKFGIAPLEGYGVTETTPAVSVNLPDIGREDSFQRGTLKGTIGQPIPGVAAKIVDAETDEPLPVGEEGMLMIKGPNVMLGYLNRPDRTAEVIRNGWYETGDIAKVDADDFITITDRASRFSKIGGEMVPHIAVEEVFLQAIDNEGRVVVVTGVPDERRGERLVVLYVDEAGTAEALQAFIEKSNLPNLWRPRSEDYIKIDAIPVLGSGKLDLKTVKECAATLSV